MDILIGRFNHLSYHSKQSNDGLVGLIKIDLLSRVIIINKSLNIYFSIGMDCIVVYSSNVKILDFKIRFQLE